MKFFFRVGLMRIHTHRNGEIWGARARKRAFVQASLDLKMAASVEYLAYKLDTVKWLFHSNSNLTMYECDAHVQPTHAHTHHIRFHLISTKQRLLTTQTLTLRLCTYVFVFIFISP